MPWLCNSYPQLSNSNMPWLQLSSSISVNVTVLLWLSCGLQCNIVPPLFSYLLHLHSLWHGESYYITVPFITQLALLLPLCQTLTSSMLAPLERTHTLPLGWPLQPRLEVIRRHFFKGYFYPLCSDVFSLYTVLLWKVQIKVSYQLYKIREKHPNTFHRSHSGSTTVLWCSLGGVSSQPFPATGCIICQSLS